MRISIEEIIDYTKCPLYYKFKYVDEIYYEKTLDELYKEYIKRSISFYYFSLIDDKIKTFENILIKWEKLWFSSEMLDKFSREDLNNRSNEAVVTLSKFYKKIASEKHTPIASAFCYDAIFQGEENIHITGDIDLIQIIGDRTRKSSTQVVFFSMSKHQPDVFILKNDLGLTVASYAFRQNFKTKEDVLLIRHVDCKDDARTLKTGGDYERAEKAIRNICKGIQQKIYYPSVSKYNCHNCKFKLLCLNAKSIQ